MTEWDPLDRAKYEQALAEGAEQYRDVIDILSLGGMTVEFTQTGGMCAALQVMLDDNAGWLLITDAEDTLAWDRRDHRGWMVGAYDDPEWQEASWIESTEDSSVDALLKLVDRALQR